MNGPLTSLKALTMCALTGAAGLAKAADYKLDLEGPHHIRNMRADSRFHIPDRVDLHVTGPAKWIDKSHHLYFEQLVPPCRLTNRTEITNLVAVLGVCDYKERITNVARLKGYTYHLLMYNDDSRSLMHFRVFEPTELKTPWCFVYSKNDTGSGYSNDQIGGWLRARLDPATNGPVPIPLEPKGR